LFHAGVAAEERLVQGSDSRDVCGGLEPAAEICAYDFARCGVGVWHVFQSTRMTAKGQGG
jgi:hypothetical protein